MLSDKTLVPTHLQLLNNIKYIFCTLDSFSCYCILSENNIRKIQVTII